MSKITTMDKIAGFAFSLVTLGAVAKLIFDKGACQNEETHSGVETGTEQLAGPGGFQEGSTSNGIMSKQ